MSTGEGESREVVVGKRLEGLVANCVYCGHLSIVPAVVAPTDKVYPVGCQQCIDHLETEGKVQSAPLSKSEEEEDNDNE